MRACCRRLVRRADQRISDAGASACCRLSLLLAALIAAAGSLVVPPDVVLGRFVLPCAIRLRLRTAHGRYTLARYRLVTCNGSTHARLRRLTVSSMRASVRVRLRRLIDRGLGTHVRGTGAVRGGRFVAAEGELTVSSLLGLGGLSRGRPASAPAT